MLRDIRQAEVELLLGNLPLIAAELAGAGLLIIYTGVREKRFPIKFLLGLKASSWIGTIKGLCLSFRGFSPFGFQADPPGPAWSTSLHQVCWEWS